MFVFQVITKAAPGTNDLRQLRADLLNDKLDAKTRQATAEQYKNLLLQSKDQKVVAGGVQDLISVALTVSKNADGSATTNFVPDDHQIAWAYANAYAATANSPQLREQMLDDLHKLQVADFTTDASMSAWDRKKLNDSNTTAAMWANQAVGTYAVCEYAAALNTVAGAKVAQVLPETTEATPAMSKAQADALVKNNSELLEPIMRALGDGRLLVKNTDGDPQIGQAVDALSAMLNLPAVAGLEEAQRKAKVSSAQAMGELWYAKAADFSVEQQANAALETSANSRASDKLAADPAVKAAVDWSRAFGRGFDDMGAGADSPRAQLYDQTSFGNIGYGLLQASGAYGNPEFPDPWPAAQGGAHASTPIVDYALTEHFAELMYQYLMDNRGKDEFNAPQAGLQIPIMAKDKKGVIQRDARGRPKTQMEDVSQKDWALYTLSHLTTMMGSTPLYNKLNGMVTDLGQNVPASADLAGSSDTNAGTQAIIAEMRANVPKIPNTSPSIDNPGWVPLSMDAAEALKSYADPSLSESDIRNRAQAVINALSDITKQKAFNQPVNYSLYVQAGQDWDSVVGGTFQAGYWHLLPTDPPNGDPVALAEADLKAGRIDSFFARANAGNDVQGLIRTLANVFTGSKTKVRMFASGTAEMFNVDYPQLISNGKASGAFVFVPHYFSLEAGVDKVITDSIGTFVAPGTAAGLSAPQFKEDVSYTADLYLKQGGTLVIPTSWLERAMASIFRSDFDKAAVAAGQAKGKPVLVSDFAHKFANYVSTQSFQTEQRISKDAFTNQWGIDSLVFRWQRDLSALPPQGNEWVTPYVALELEHDTYTGRIDPNTGNPSYTRGWRQPIWQIGATGVLPIKTTLIESTLTRVSGGGAQPQGLVTFTWVPDALLANVAAGTHAQLDATFNTNTFFSPPAQRPFVLNLYTSYDIHQPIKDGPDMTLFSNINYTNDYPVLGPKPAWSVNLGVRANLNLGWIGPSAP